MENDEISTTKESVATQIRVFVSGAAEPVGESLAAGLQKQGGYEIVGCVPRISLPCPQLTESAAYDEEDKCVQLALSSQVIILCMCDVLAAADAIIHALQQSRNAPRRSRKLILVSSLATWGGLPPPLRREDYTGCQPSCGYLEHARLEQAALHLNSVDGALKACVVTIGASYNSTGGPLLPLFRDAWTEGVGTMPTVGTGEHQPPLVHMDDLVARVSVLVGEAGDFSKPYIIGAESCASTGQQPTLAELCTKIVIAAEPEATQPPPMTQDSFAELLIDAPSSGTASSLISLHLDLPLPQSGKDIMSLNGSGGWAPAEGGSLAAVPVLWKTFLKAHRLEPLRVVITGPPGSGKSLIAASVSTSLGLPFVDLRVALDQLLSDTSRPPLPSQPSQDPSLQAVAGERVAAVKNVPPVKGGKKAPNNAPTPVTQPLNPSSDASILAEIDFALGEAAAGNAQWWDVLPPLDAGVLTTLLSVPVAAALIHRQLAKADRRKGYMLNLAGGTWSLLSKSLTSLSAAKGVKWQPEEALAPTHIVSVKTSREAILAGLEGPVLAWQEKRLDTYIEAEGKPDSIPAAVSTLLKTLTNIQHTEVSAGEDAAVTIIQTLGGERTLPHGATNGGTVNTSSSADLNETSSDRPATAVQDSTAPAAGIEVRQANNNMGVSPEDEKLLQEAAAPIRQFLIETVMEEVAHALLSVTECQPPHPDPVSYVGEWLVKAGKLRERRAEAEAGLRFAAGYALLNQLEEK